MSESPSHEELKARILELLPQQWSMGATLQAAGCHSALYWRLRKADPQWVAQLNAVRQHMHQSGNEDTWQDEPDKEPEAVVEDVHQDTESVSQDHGSALSDTGPDDCAVVAHGGRDSLLVSLQQQQADMHRRLCWLETCQHLWDTVFRDPQALRALTTVLQRAQGRTQGPLTALLAALQRLHQEAPDG